MKENLLSKTLAIAIIILFFGVSVVSSAVDINKNVDDEYNENSKSKPFDSYTEIFTYISAHVYGIKLKGIGLLFNVEIWGVDSTIDMQGYRYPLFPLGESHFVVSADHVIAPHFIGICYPVTVDTYGVIGIAIGNIEWS